MVGAAKRFGWFAALVLLAGSALAEPYIAVREGMQCAACHTNVTGGGKRTDIVTMHPQDVLHYPDFLPTFSSPVDSFTGDINSYVAIGANLRASYTAIFQEDDDDGRVDNNTAFRPFSESDLDVTEAVGFLELRIIPGLLTLYADQRVAPTTDNREAFALLYGVLPWDGFVKAGRMFLPYGLQLQDDRAFIRDGYEGVSPRTGFSFDNSQAALELGVQPGPLSLIAAVSEGTSGDKDVQLTGTVSALFTELPVVRNVLVGGSFAVDELSGSETTLFGLFAGITIERLTLLGEGDFRSEKNASTGGSRHGTFIAYGEADYLLFDWLNLKATVDYADDDGDLTQHGDDSTNRVSFGLEPFLSRFVQPRLFYRIGNGVESQPRHNRDELLAELHFFF